MINKKERIKLRSLSMNIKPTIIVGKEGFTENVFNQINEELYNHELIKLSLLETCEPLSEFQLTELAVKLGAEVVTCIGRKIVLYKHSEKKNISHVL